MDMSVDTRTGDIILSRIAVLLTFCRFHIREALILVDIVESIETETIDSHVCPVGDDVFHLIGDLRILPVEIRLLYGEKMEIIAVRLLIVLPGRSAKDAHPVGRLTAVLFRFTEDIVVMISAVAVTGRIDEPGVFIGSMIDHQIHEQAHASLMDLFAHPLPVIQSPEIRIDVPVVCHIIAVVGFR